MRLMVAVLLSAVVALIEGSSLIETAGIALAVILSTTIAFITEFRSNREFDALNRYLHASDDVDILRQTVNREKDVQSLWSEDRHRGPVLCLVHHVA